MIVAKLVELASLVISIAWIWRHDQGPLMHESVGNVVGKYSYRLSLRFSCLVGSTRAIEILRFRCSSDIVGKRGDPPSDEYFAAKSANVSSETIVSPASLRRLPAESPGNPKIQGSLQRANRLFGLLMRGSLAACSRRPTQFSVRSALE